MHLRAGQGVRLAVRCGLALSHIEVSPVAAPVTQHDDSHDLTIWLYALGYFAAYAPYSALTKALSTGALPGMEQGIVGFTLLPVSAVTSMVGMFVFLSLKRWWRFASQREVMGVKVPMPGAWTFVSGMCSAAIIATTTLAYALEGTSIVFMMLLMRGGVLVLAPVVDVLSRRRVKWPSWLALGLSLSAVVVASASDARATLSVVAAVDVGVYLLSYFIRLRAMSRLAKSEDKSLSTRYFVEEQMVATPFLVLILALAALWGGSAPALDLREGFLGVFARGRLLEEMAVGLFSQGTGIFGGLILLDARENAFSVPVNRASSVLAGVVASVGLSVGMGLPGVGSRELMGAGLVMVAMVVLALPTVLAARRREAAARAALGR
ncbi:hypothetical protein JY572_06860 [Myxococcus landrumensis]|uniref:EamA domain-containing protein n=1 Tax=Myxococcus landrumensis TaxID=2813577 RepID=A0ABX7NKR0_9BACT|nr:hypothetical protein JY572_06860 [Myxococcus landrumus]